MSEGDEEDEASKTEEPSHKRLEDAFEEGNVINSKEVSNFLSMLTLAMMIAWVIPLVFKHLLNHFKILFSNIGDINVTSAQIGVIMQFLCGKAIMYLLPLFLTLVFVAIFSHFIQVGRLVFSTKSLEPDISKLSPMKGFKKIFCRKNFVELLKNITKLSFVGIFIFLVIWSDIKEMRMYQDLSVMSILLVIFNTINHIMVAVCIILAVLAGADFLYQRYEYYQSLRMTKHQIKEEYKQTEGSPEIKKAQRQKRAEIAQRDIKQAVPEADVIITNPEHFAVALKYNPEEMEIPIVVAKGLDLIAFKIRELADDNNIPIVENPPLARALYRSVEVGDPVPFEHFESVAKVIGYVYSLKNKKL